ncbi:hypothetical protein TruAng_012250 [Truncatella angustata]|nr:hypothetical protein TruAng_012250 [Truncatella angustata]
MAIFFAQSWHQSTTLDEQAAAVILQDCRTRLDQMLNHLPSRFQKRINQAHELVPKLFAGAYPMVITHGDLSEMNILVHPETGTITGIIDWAEAAFLPFGFALYALDSILGHLTLDGWIFHNGAHILRNEFWAVFHDQVPDLSQQDMENIRLARLTGACSVMARPTVLDTRELRLKMAGNKESDTVVPRWVLAIVVLTVVVLTVID